MRIKKSIIFYLLNVMYLLVGIAFLLYFYYTFSLVKTAYETTLFVIVVLIYIILVELTNSVLSKFISLIYVSIFGLYLMAQNIYESVFSQYFRWSYVFSLKKEVTSFQSSVNEYLSIMDFMPFIIFAVITIIFIIIYFVFQRKIKINRKFLLIRLCSLLLFIPCILAFNSYNGLLYEARHQEDSFQLNHTDYYLYETIYSSEEFVEKFGLIPFCYRDIEKTFEIEDYEQYRDEVTEFLANKPDHADNDLTGIFKGKDVIFVQAESYNRYALDEDLTPTLYKMATKGINVVGFDTPSLVGSTSDTEFMANISLVPDSEEYASCYRYINNEYDYTLASIFKDAGYFTESFHNCYGTYYNRSILFPSEFKYDSFRDCTEMGFENFMDDYTFASDLYWMYDNASKPFMAYWVTFSGHQPYTYKSHGMKEEYFELINQKYPNLDEAHITYLAKNMDLDRTIESILSTAEYFEKQNELVIVFFGDHAAKIGELDDKYQTELYIYCPEKELCLNYNKMSTCLDLLPTIANMFGLEYDDKKVFGRDIFDETYDGMLIKYGFEINTPSYHIDPQGNVTDLFGNPIVDKTILDEANRYYNYKRISKIIQKIDYFKQ